VKVAVLVARSLHGGGFATRVSSMLQAYVGVGFEVDVFHYRRPHEEQLPPSIAASLNRYVTLPIDADRYRQHASLLPPLAWQCVQSQRASTVQLGHYDVTQSETSAAWAVARQFPAERRLVVFHDDDSARLRALARTGPRNVRSAVGRLAGLKYSRWQHTVVNEADRIWFVSGVERDRLTPPGRADRTRVVPNGANDELWLVPPPDARSGADVLFVAPGFYEANARGLQWFLVEVWPLVKQQVAAARLRVVGLGWERFPPHPDVSFVGWKESLAAEYASSRVVIAPLFAGGGTKIKIIEAMAAARPVVTTPVGAEAVPSSTGTQVSADREVFASGVVTYLTDHPRATQGGTTNRSAVQRLRWSSIWTEAARDLVDLVHPGGVVAEGYE
jgi:glycosyltransferase involved in cell wall biosynthesis